MERGPREIVRKNTKEFRVQIYKKPLKHRYQMCILESSLWKYHDRGIRTMQSKRPVAQKAVKVGDRGRILSAWFRAIVVETDNYDG